MITKIVGLSFTKVKEPSIKKGSPVEIIHDKDNKFSSRALAVYCNGVKVGHIGEKGNEQHEEIFNALPVTGTVHTIARLEQGEEFAKFEAGEITHLEIEFKMPSDEQNGIRSFNEDVLIKFDPMIHRYTYNGRELIGGTSYIKKWIKEFDSEAIAGVYAEKLGTKKSEVLEFWNNGGKVASHYGTSIHNALEHYERFKKLGKIIQDKKELPYNKAMPNHPELRKIVEQFVTKFGDHEVETEVLVTNTARGLCGMIDRLVVLDKDKKICRVEDYKATINAEAETQDKYLGQFAGLPKNKLSKYRLQLSFYARLLELSGWKVEGLRVYVFENEWKQFDMEVLSLDF